MNVLPVRFFLPFDHIIHSNYYPLLSDAGLLSYIQASGVNDV